MTDKTPITWKDCKRKLRDLKAWDENPAEITEGAAGRLSESLGEFGQFQTLAIDPENWLVDGHQRLGVWMAKFGPDYEVDCRVASRMLTTKERQKIAVYLRSGTTGRYNWDKLSGWDSADLHAWGMDNDTLREWKTDVAALGNLLGSEEVAQSAENQEIPEQWGIIIECQSEQEQNEMLERFLTEGITCRALLS